MERGSIRTKAVVQIQNDAPLQLLVGTDLLHSLGDFLLQEPEKDQNQIVRFTSEDHLEITSY